MADERTQNTPLNVNEKIQDRTIRHMVYLERYKAGEVRRIINKLENEIIPEINAKLEARLAKIAERGSDVGRVTARRLASLEKELQKLVVRLKNNLQKELIIDLDDFTRDELRWQINNIKESLGFDLDLIVPNPKAVSDVIKRTSFAGSTLDQWFNSLSNATQRNIMTAVNRGIVEGETTGQIMQRVRGTRRLNYTDGVWQTTRRQAEAVTRSTINHATNQARLEFFKKNDDIIKGLQWTSTLDSRTSVICAGLDGRVFPIDKGARPPAHVNCRSTMTPVLKDYRKLGLKNLPEGQRASINGQVPQSLTYGKWLKRQPIDVQEEVLGVTKAKLFRQGNVPIERFTSQRLKPLSLKELRMLEKNAFKETGL